jgi:glycosyltransferase involved in cell wall biosynthesis
MISSGPVLHRVIERFGEGVAIRFMGRTPPPVEIRGLPNVTWERVAFLDYSAFARWFATQRVDIGLAPLEDTSFNRGKSGIKFLEYTAIGAASVCSRVPAYVDSVHEGEGLLVGSEEWEEALIRLVTDGALRRQLAGVAREGVRRRWLLSNRAAEWTDVYAHICAAPRDEIRVKLGLALDAAGVAR